MDTDTIRFYIIHKFFFNEPLQGWTIESLHKELSSYFNEISVKPIRTYLNNLVKKDIISVHTMNKVKYYSLNREYLSYDSELPESEQVAEQILVAQIVSLLNNSDLRDLSPLISEIKKRLKHSYNTRWNQISAISDTMKWSFIELFDNKLETLKFVQFLFQNKNHLLDVELLFESNIEFLFHNFLIRDGRIVAIGLNNSTKSYQEININSIKNIEIIQVQPNINIPKSINNLITFSSINIGQPTLSQSEIIVFSLSDNFLKQYQGNTIHLDAEIDYDEGKMILHHQITDDLIHWIIGFGSSIKVESPISLKETVKKRLVEMSELYS